MARTPGLKSLSQGRRDMFEVAPGDIEVIEGWNSRDFSDPENIAHIEQLAASIEQNGVLEPLSGYYDSDKNKFVLTNGESRIRAIRLLAEKGVEIKSVPCRTEPRHANEADHLASQIIRNSGRPFTPMENAALFVKLTGHGWTTAEIANKVGFTTERVAQILELHALPSKVKQRVKAGEISPTLAGKIKAKAKSARETTATVEGAIKAARTEGKKKATERHVKAAKRLTATPPAETKSSSGKSNSKPVVDFKALYVQLMDHLVDHVEQTGEPPTVQLGVPRVEWLEFVNQHESAKAK